ncbi:hypothetical protein JTB14_003914 [Gonioctena quinquepunctata]|nr:hypothetical protein JTB14_003914 [Gonioctena quinquepunctata]
MLRQRLSENYSSYPYGTPKTHNLKEENSVLSERKIAVCGLILSFLVIAAKVFTNYSSTIEKIILEQKLVTYKVLTEDGNEMLMYTWKTVAKYSHIWFPAVCGLLSSYFTWIMVYLDSNVPGVQPPSPLSPKKYQLQSGHTFHLNYVFAMIVGILVFVYMYIRGVSINFAVNMEHVTVFSEKFQNVIHGNVYSAILESGYKEEAVAASQDWLSNNENSLSCSYCRVEFSDPQSQREHYKLDWHRYNLKQSLLSKPHISEEEFDEKTGNDDLSSISGSDSEKEDTLDTYAIAQGKIFLQNRNKEVFALYRCLLSDRKEDISDDVLSTRLKECSHVKSIVDTWKSEIARSSLVVYRASGPYNRSVLFGGAAPLLDRTSKNLRTIPFSTRRATFTEVKRVHSLLSTAILYDSLEKATEFFSKQKSPDEVPKRNKLHTTCINRAKSRESVERPLPTLLSSSSGSEVELDGIDGGVCNLELETNDLEISFNDLREFDDSLTPEQRKKRTAKKKPKKSKAKKLKEQEEASKKEIVDLLVKGDLEKLKQLMREHSEKQLEENEKEDFVNKIIDDNSNSLLHLAALNEHADVIKYLLENGADLCLKNKNQQTTYTCTQSKEIREYLKEFAREHPDKFNYNKANIPTNTLSNEEIAEKKKAQRKLKREKEKEKKKENDIKKKEEAEKDRFLKLSDREKRALAAERRIISQSGTVTKRCFLCAADIAGKVPFEYMKNLFCSIECLKAHRMQNPVVLS